MQEKHLNLFNNPFFKHFVLNGLSPFTPNQLFSNI